MMKKSDNKKSGKNKIVNVPICRKCNVLLTDENWYPSHKRKHDYICKECKIKCVKKWKQNNRDKHNQSNRKSNHLLRDDVIEEYGGVCACCGEPRKEYLTIDHVEGNGGKHLRELGLKGGDQFYRWLGQNNYPKGFQVLCFNCNLAKGSYSICPQSEEFQMLFDKKLKQSYSARHTWNLRLDTIKAYGGKCQLCGESNPYFMSIDHVYGDGAKERKITGSGVVLYRKLKNEGYPKDRYRLLCYNCNCALGHGRITEEEILHQNKKEK